MLVEWGDSVLATEVDAIFEAATAAAPFGQEVAIVDWKTGSTAKSHPSQLHTYAYGGRREGWFPQDQQWLGAFFHCEAQKLQVVSPYIGDEQVEAWIAGMFALKNQMLDSGSPIYNPDWWCNYCQARDLCPANGGSESYEQVALTIKGAEVLTIPQDQE